MTHPISPTRPDNLPAPDTDSGRSLLEIYNNTKYLSVKWDSYFPVYEKVLQKYVGTRITFVEVGVLNGGSLFMWRTFLGSGARIIGIDRNPLAKKWERDGFEIYIGDQADENFWKDFYAKVGPIDVLLDDGGHTNIQQIVTTTMAIDQIKDGGLVMVEDVHTSYLRKFGNPSKHSFINFAKHLIDAINSRNPRINCVASDYGRKIYSAEFYESIVVLNIDSRLSCVSKRTSNHGETSNAIDFRHAGTALGVMRRFARRLDELLPFLKGSALLKRVTDRTFPVIWFFASRYQNRRSRKYFR